jgi:hypothetical protein
MWIPVVDANQKPLMPTTETRARRWHKSGKGTMFWKRGVLCVRLNVTPSARHTQPIAVGIDPGSKKEAFTIKTDAHTYLNLQVDAVTWVKDAVETRRNMRRARRFRNTPCRANRQNRKRGGIPPSTFARWNWKLRICKWLAKMFPITGFVVEDIAAVTKAGQRRWNKSFSPLEVGKKWFYEQISKMGTLETRKGFETFTDRNNLGLKKTKAKMSEVFEAHCVDSWVLANWWTGGHIKPDNKAMLLITPLRLHRRQLHRLQAETGGKRKPYGSTRSMGFKRGSLVRHIKHGLTYIGGELKGRISLHSLATGQRLCQNALPAETTFLAYSTWRAHSSPQLKLGVSNAHI